MGQYACEHGLFDKTCRCPQPHTVSCGEIKNHDLRLQVLQDKEREENPLFAIRTEPDGTKSKVITVVKRMYPAHFTYDELQILDDALAYYRLSYPFDMVPDPEDYSNKDVADLSDGISKLRETASELEPL
jgi:hypothetical protein